MRTGFAARIAIALLVLLTATAASACGHCVEDRIAAVYDHALVQRALASKHQIVYFAWDGSLAGDEASRRKLLALLEGVAGVDKGSARVSMDPAAIAVSFDPQRSNGASMAAALQTRLKVLGVAIVPLRMPAADGR